VSWDFRPFPNPFDGAFGFSRCHARPFQYRTKISEQPRNGRVQIRSRFAHQKDAIFKLTDFELGWSLPKLQGDSSLQLIHTRVFVKHRGRGGAGSGKALERHQIAESPDIFRRLIIASDDGKSIRMKAGNVRQDMEQHVVEMVEGGVESAGDVFQNVGTAGIGRIVVWGARAWSWAGGHRRAWTRK